MRDALRFVHRNRIVFVTFVVMVIVSTFAFNYGVALPELADERWGGESWFGLVLSVTGIGSFVGLAAHGPAPPDLDAVVPRLHGRCSASPGWRWRGRRTS